MRAAAEIAPCHDNVAGANLFRKLRTDSGHRVPGDLFDLVKAGPKRVRAAPCQEVVETDRPSLAALPILRCWPGDGGRYITLPLVFTRDPVTGARNVGMYRMQVYDERTTGMHWQTQKHGAEHFRRARAKSPEGRIAVSVAIGADPATALSGMLPIPPDLDEMMFAGFLRREPVEMVSCETNDLEVPANAEIVLEDHFAGDAINHGVAARAGFVASFDGEAVSELDQLRADFLRKAVMAGTDVLCRSLMAAGAQPSALAEMTMGQVPPPPEPDRLRQRRAELGLPAQDASPLVIDPVTGAPVDAAAMPLHLRRAHTTRVRIEANTGSCRGMVRHRYQSPGLGGEGQ